MAIDYKRLMTGASGVRPRVEPTVDVDQLTAAKFEIAQLKHVIGVQTEELKRLRRLLGHGLLTIKSPGG